MIQGERCLVCNSASRVFLYDLTHPQVHNVVGLAGNIFKCAQCGFLFKEYKVQIQEVYSNAYATNMLSLEKYFNTYAEDFFKKIIKSAQACLPVLKQPLNLLDIGCGVGLVLDAARSENMNATGVELSEKLAKITSAKGHNVIHGDIADVDFKINNKYNIITMLDIIEHLGEPKKMLLSIKNLMSDHAVLVIYTPNHNALIVKVARWLYKLGVKSPVENFFASTHTGFFDKKSLTHLTVDSGYKIERFEFSRYNIQQPGQYVPFFSKVTIYLCEIIGIFLGFGGFRMTAYLKKI